MTSSSSDSESYIESSDDEYDNESTYGGHAQNILSSIDKSIEKIDDFLAFGRLFMQGDIVCSVTNSSGQLGRVVDVDMIVNLETSSGELVKDINSKNLSRLLSFASGDYVVHGPWLGRVKSVFELVTVVFSDGAKCELMTGDADVIMSVSPNLSDYAPYPYYPGQRVRVNKSRREGIVCHVEVGLVDVNWIASVITNADIPYHRQEPKKLTLLSCFPYANWQNGDWCTLPVGKDIYVVSKTKTKVDVVWQNGTISTGVDSDALSPVAHVNDHDFWPEQYVLEKETEKLGIVRNVNSQEQTVRVKWMLPDNESEEIVSAYELIDHPDFSYGIGDIVFRMLPNLDEYATYIGNVVAFKDEGLEVKWASGLITKVHPSEIFGIERLDYASSAYMDETTIQENQLRSEKEKVVHDSGYMWNTVTFLAKLAANLFGSFGSKSHENSESYLEDSSPEVPEEQDEQFKPSPEYKKIEQFKQFDIVDNYSDHYFANNVCKGLVTKDWSKKVQQEWSILKKNLPDDIYVRVYEERNDLLRACIKGASETPYHNGLFFFDIAFPPDYPHEPPMVHYNSGGLRLNPNLYESGKVCLSLLKTWAGTGTEVWNSEKSTLLQVLVSLQALVLNEKPYFNEAGYEKQLGRAEEEKNSVNYNENVFLVTLKTMMYHLRKPPKHFDEFVEQHFSVKAHSILVDCKAYMDNKKMSSAGFKIMLAKLYPKLASAFAEKGINCN